MPEQVVITITRVRGNSNLSWHCDIAGMAEIIRDVEGAPEAIINILTDVINRIKPTNAKVH